MNPVLFDAPWGPVNAYGTMILLGMVVAFPGVWWDARQRGLSLAVVLDVYLAVFIGGFVGGKAPLWFDDSPLAATGGFVFYGSAVGAAAAVWWVAKRHRVPATSLVAIGMTWIAICQFFGRLGCTLAGCCYGAESVHTSIGLRYPAESIAFAERVAMGLANVGDHTPALHPVPVYEATGLVLVFLFVFAVRWRRGPRDDLAPAFAWALAYGLLRSILEVWRATSDRWFLIEVTSPVWAGRLALPADHALALSGSQLASAALVTIGTIGLWHTIRRPGVAVVGREPVR